MIFILKQIDKIEQTKKRALFQGLQKSFLLSENKQIQQITTIELG